MTVTPNPSDAAGAALGSRSPELFRNIGGAIYRRLREVTGGDERRARAEGETLFVRFYSRFRGRAGSGPASGSGDERAYWAWIYRVATIHALRALTDDARAGHAGGAPAAPVPAAESAVVPPMQVLRGFDEATQAVVVLNRLDGLSPGEIAEVVELPLPLVERKLGDVASAGGAGPAAAAPPPEHPSRLALDRDRREPIVAAHLSACGPCRALTEEADRVAAAFAASTTPEVLERVVRAIRAEEARRASGPRWKRIGWLGGAFVGVTIMAFAVARPREPKPDETPFRGGGASRAKAAGLQITSRRGTDVGALAPGMFSRLGDRLHFRLRAEGPRYLEVRARSPQGGQVRIFPASGAVAVRVTPGEALDHDYVLGPPVATPGHWLVVEGLTSEHEFPLDKRPGRDIEVVTVRIDIEP